MSWWHWARSLPSCTTTSVCATMRRPTVSCWTTTGLTAISLVGHRHSQKVEWVVSKLQGLTSVFLCIHYSGDLFSRLSLLCRAFSFICSAGNFLSTETFCYSSKQLSQSDSLSSVCQSGKTWRPSYREGHKVFSVDPCFGQVTSSLPEMSHPVFQRISKASGLSAIYIYIYLHTGDCCCTMWWSSLSVLSNNSL